MPARKPVEHAVSLSVPVQDASLRNEGSVWSREKEPCQWEQPAGS